MEEILVEWGLPALFLLSFAAATIAPVGSEWLLAVLLLKGAAPYPAVILASAGNFLGACTTYWLGNAGSRYLSTRKWAPDSGKSGRAKMLFDRYGSWSLLLTWLPVIGDALCLLAGALRINFVKFSILTLSGKAARYAAVAAVALG